jgi:hypothetical protein
VVKQPNLILRHKTTKYEKAQADRQPEQHREPGRNRSRQQ